MNHMTDEAVAPVPADRTAQDRAGHRAAFLEQMRRVPGSVAVVASTEGDEQGGLVVTAWSSLCADPPMILVCVNRSASAHDLIVRSGAFGLSLLPLDAGDVVGHFSGKSGLTGKERFVAPLWAAGPNGQPLLERAVVAFECRTEAVHIHGTHSILIGRVDAMRRDDAGQAMVYLDGRYAAATPV